MGDRYRRHSRVRPILWVQIMGRLTIMGIDPGIANIGYGVIRGREVLGSGVITTASHRKIEDRLVRIGSKISSKIRLYEPDIIVIEMFIINRGMRRRRNITSIAMAYGVISYVCHKTEAQVIFAQPNVWMRRFLRLTPKAQFSKLDIRERVQRVLDYDVQIEHEAEALGLALSIERR